MGLVDVVTQVVEVSPYACAELVPGQEIPALPASRHDPPRVQHPLFRIWTFLPKVPEASYLIEQLAVDTLRDRAESRMVADGRGRRSRRGR